MKRYAELRVWARVAAGACKRCSSSVAFAIRNQELGEKDSPEMGCDHPADCKAKVRRFWPSRPMGDEKFRGLDIAPCEKDPRHNTLVVRVGERRVQMCAYCKPKE